MKKMYKISSLLLCLVLVISSFSIVAFAEEGETGGTEEPTVLLGDMDLNGKVETTDARLILRISAGVEALTDDYLSIGDMNSDGNITLEDAILALRQVANVEDFVLPDKNGENFLTHNPENEFIKLIADTYNLDPASLVAIFSVPDSGTNYVLEFKGTGLLGNKPPFEKSVDNLKKVYHIGAAPERKISYTDGKLVLGDHYNCEPAEGVMVFSLVKTMVMEQYPDYFSGTGESK